MINIRKDIAKALTLNRIIAAQHLAPNIKLFKVSAPAIAKNAKPGQFVILRTDEKGERFPLTIVDWQREKGEITLIFQQVGVSTGKLGTLEVGDEILDIVGPLGNPSDIRPYSPVAVIGGGVGMATAYPIAKALKEEGNTVTSIMGARTKNLLVMADEMRSVSDEFYICTDDGSEGYKGFVSDLLKSLLEDGRKFPYVYAVGPPLMMKAVADVTRFHGIKTIVSLNPIMVDGMGMCGACRVTVGGQTKFACVDGPEFDAHQVNFDELINRLRMYQPEEKLAQRFYAHFLGSLSAEAR